MPVSQIILIVLGLIALYVVVKATTVGSVFGTLTSGSSGLIHVLETGNNNAVA